MGWIYTIVIGLIAGLLARFIMPGKQTMGMLLTICLGIAGSITFTFLGQMLGWYKGGEGAHLIGSTVGALLILFVVGMIKKS